MDPVILTVAFVMGYLAYRLGLPPLVGFLLAGLGLSAFGLTASPLLKTGSEVGVTLLLFTIGLKLKIKDLAKPEVWAVASQLEAGRCVSEGDVMDPDFWRRLPAPQGVVKLVVLALSNLDVMLYAAGKLKEIGYRGDVAAVARYDDEVEALRAAGVNTAFNIYGEAGAGLAAHVCESLETFQR